MNIFAGQHPGASNSSKEGLLPRGIERGIATDILEATNCQRREKTETQSDRRQGKQTRNKDIRTEKEWPCECIGNEEPAHLSKQSHEWILGNGPTS